MNSFAGGARTVGSHGLERESPSCRDLLRAATQAPHERLHLHPGLSAVKDGTITRADYRALLTRLHGFHLPFEQAIGGGTIHTQWLARDLSCLGAAATTNVCPSIPRYDNPERRLGALYVVEGAALGGRTLYRGLDHLLGPTAIEGRRFFAGRGAATGDAWRAYLNQLAAAGPSPACRAALVSAAVETFEVFETWLAGWSATS